MSSEPPRPSASSAPRGLGEPAFPPRVTVSHDEPVKTYYARRLAQHTADWYCGIRLQKFPEDLRTYEHLIWDSAATVVIELGCHRGGSTLWLRDRLVALERYRPGSPVPLVVGIGLDTAPAREGVGLRDPDYARTIQFLDGSILDPELPERVQGLLPANSPCLVIEDTAHEYETTMAALTGYARFVRPGGYFVVEDGVVDDPELTDSSMGAGGVLRAVGNGSRRPPGRSSPNGATSSCMA